jgi:DinB family protein
MPLSPAEREDRIERYARGPARLTAALGRVPEEARKWRPGTGKWSVHEVVCHCADSELNAAARIRYLVAEKEPVIVGYDQEEWARRFDYHKLPLEPALQTVEAVRANTVALLRRLPADAWSREGRHTESGRYGVDDWLNSYAEHLEKHSGQIERNLEAWKASRGVAGS